MERFPPIDKNLPHTPYQTPVSPRSGSNSPSVTKKVGEQSLQQSKAGTNPLRKSSQDLIVQPLSPRPILKPLSANEANKKKPPNNPPLSNILLPPLNLSGLSSAGSGPLSPRQMQESGRKRSDTISPNSSLLFNSTPSSFKKQVERSLIPFTRKFDIKPENFPIDVHHRIVGALTKLANMEFPYDDKDKKWLSTLQKTCDQLSSCDTTESLLTTYHSIKLKSKLANRVFRNLLRNKKGISILEKIVDATNQAIAAKIESKAYHERVYSWPATVSEYDKALQLPIVYNPETAGVRSLVGDNEVLFNSITFTNPVKNHKSILYDTYGKEGFSKDKKLNVIKDFLEELQKADYGSHKDVNVSEIAKLMIEYKETQFGEMPLLSLCTTGFSPGQFLARECVGLDGEEDLKSKWLQSNKNWSIVILAPQIFETCRSILMEVHSKLPPESHQVEPESSKLYTTDITWNLKWNEQTNIPEGRLKLDIEFAPDVDQTVINKMLQNASDKRAHKEALYSCDPLAKKMIHQRVLKHQIDLKHKIQQQNQADKASKG